MKFLKLMSTLKYKAWIQLFQILRYITMKRTKEIKYNRKEMMEK